MLQVPTLHAENLRAWIGRSVCVNDRLDPGPSARLAAALDRVEDVREGAALAPLRHWLHFLPGHAASELGADGAVRRSDFLPPIARPRRMWAGSRIEWRRPLLLGSAVTRTTTIADIVEKTGRSGALLFLKLRHEYADAAGVALVEEQDAVYRDAPVAGAPPAAAATLAPDDPEWTRTHEADEVLLFRYSALTFNGHRIHYDWRYATAVEGYPGLLVHGPLLATWLLDHLRDRLRDGASLATFAFRSVHPVVHPGPVTVCAAELGAGRFRLWVRDADHRLCMDAEVSTYAPQ